MKTESGEILEIVLPRDLIGAIHSLPGILALQALMIRDSGAEKPAGIKLYAPVKLFETISALGLAETRLLDEGVKLRSWLNPPKKIIFLNDSVLNLGFRGLETYGLKRHYTKSLPFLDLQLSGSELSEDLRLWLGSDYGFSLSVMRYFGIPLALGWTVDDLKETFRFCPQSSLVLKQPITSWKPSIAHKSYLVIAPETAQRWQWDDYLALIEEAYATSRQISVVIGQNAQKNLPRLPYLLDLREKLNYPQISQLLNSAGFLISEDPFLLQLANLMHTDTLSPSGTIDLKLHGPIFPLWHSAQKPIELLTRPNDALR